MNGASTAAVVVFLATVIAVALAFVLGLRATMPTRWWLVALIVGVGWLAIPGVLARSHLIDRYDPLPAPALIVVAVLTLATTALGFSSVGKRFAEGLPLAALVGFQVFRVPVEWTLHRLYLDGVVPVQMTYSGRNFDIVSGATAGLLALWLASGRRSWRTVLAWNVLGSALLANIVTIAVLSTPVPFAQFAEHHRLPSTFPFVWLPTFLVQAALFGHLVVFRALRARKAHPVDQASATALSRAP
jgi:hypothetical protein